jgi:hypothetical protein
MCPEQIDRERDQSFEDGTAFLFVDPIVATREIGSYLDEDGENWRNMFESFE